jgi:hypothetical protein
MPLTKNKPLLGIVTEPRHYKLKKKKSCSSAELIKHQVMKMCEEVEV